MDGIALHAIALAALPLAAVGVALRWQRRPTDHQLALALLPAALLMMWDLIPCLCWERHPFRQHGIGGMATFVAFAFVGPTLLRRVVGFGALLITLALGMHYDALITSGRWTSVPDLERRSIGINQGMLRRVQADVDACVAASSGAPLAPGWLRESDLARNCKRLRDLPRPHARRSANHQWHSVLTGLFRRNEVHRDFWFTEGAEMNIEIRDRPKG